MIGLKAIDCKASAFHLVIDYFFLAYPVQRGHTFLKMGLGKNRGKNKI